MRMSAPPLAMSENQSEAMAERPTVDTIGFACGSTRAPHISWRCARNLPTPGVEGPQTFAVTRMPAISCSVPSATGVVIGEDMRLRMTRTSSVLIFSGLTT